MTITRSGLSSQLSQTVVHGDTIYLAGQLGSAFALFGFEH